MMKAKQLFDKIYSSLFLLIGVLFAILATGFFMFVIALPYGSVMASRGSDYWGHVWIAFDKLWNAILRGDHRETISSRLGKSVYFNHPPVFVYRKTDKKFSWWLSQVDKDHCKKSIDWKVGIRVKEYRDIRK